MINKSEKKNILIFAQYYIPGVKGGGPIRSIKNIVDHLSSKYNFYIVTSDRDYGDSTSYKNIKVNKWYEKEGINIFYASPDWYKLSNIKNLMIDIKWDCLYLNSFFGFKFSIMPLIVAKIIKCNKKIIVAPRGELDKGALNIKKMKKVIYITLSKYLNLYKNINWHATCDQEKENIQNVFKKSEKICIASNLSAKVDTLKYIRTKEKQVGKLEIIFLSRISRKKNLKFAIKALRELQGDIVFDIYGPIEDKLYWEECMSEVSKLPRNIKVSYKGILLNENVKSVLSKYDLFFLPTFGENFGHVIIEAFLSGCPVLISNTTPWNNLEEKKVGWDIDLNNEEYFKEVLQKVVYIDNDEYSVLSKKSYEYGISSATNNNDVIKHIELFEM